MTDPAYQRLDLPAAASPVTVLRAAVRALHPDTRAVRGFRTARKRFYRQMLCAHAARQAAGDLNRPGFTGGQNSRRIARYGTDTKEEDLEAVFT